MDEPKTIIKIRLTRTHREVWSLAKFLVAFAGLLAIIATAQVVVCKQDDPRRTIRECLTKRGGNTTIQRND